MRKSIIVGLSLVAVFLLGVVLGSKIDERRVGSTSSDVRGDATDTFQAGWDAAKGKLTDAGFFPEVGEIKSVSGQITAIDGNKITIKSNPSFNPLEDMIEMRVVTIDNGTVIKLQKNKSAEQIQKDMEDFSVAISSAVDSEGAMTTTPPDMFITEELNASNLKVGDSIMIIADEDIEKKKEFRAVEVTVISRGIESLSVIEDMAIEEDDNLETEIVE